MLLPCWYKFKNGAGTPENYLVVTYKVKYDPVNPLLDIYPTEKSYIHTKELYIIVYSTYFHSCPKLETNIFYWVTDKQTGIFLQ